MLVDAVLLAFALADQFRILQNEKFLAEKLANIDHLTGIWNRRGFQQLVSPLWHTGLRNQHHMSVILMDLDQFKRVNDRHGHASGDQVLQQTASMLNSSARAGDVLARWGGRVHPVSTRNRPPKPRILQSACASPSSAWKQASQTCP